MSGLFDTDPKRAAKAERDYLINLRRVAEGLRAEAKRAGADTVSVPFEMFDALLRRWKPPSKMVPEEVQTYRQTLGRIYRRKLMARIAKGEKRKPVLYELSQVMAKEHPHAHLKPETAKRYIESPQSRPGRKRRGATT